MPCSTNWPLLLTSSRTCKCNPPPPPLHLNHHHHHHHRFSLSYPLALHLHYDNPPLSHKRKRLLVVDCHCCFINININYTYRLPCISESNHTSTSTDDDTCSDLTLETKADKFEQQQLEEEEEGDNQKAAAAREAVSEILQENGVSKEESIEISMKSPKYLEMLMDGVRDLDDFQSALPSSSSSSSSSSNYKDKVYQMAKQKGDKGLLPLLESMVGLPLPSAIRIARYLSSHTSSPSLLHKVKYLKKVLFSDNDGKVPIGRSGRRMMMQLSVPVDEDLQQTLSFLEKIQARRGGLDLLGSGDGAFRYLIESFPRLLSLSVEHRMKPLVDFLEYAGVPRGCIRNILLLFPPILFYDIEKDIKRRMQFFSKVYGEDKEFGRMLLKYPWVLSTRVQENYEEILVFFSQEKVAEISIYGAIKSWPLLLGCSVVKLKLMLDQIRELGVTEKMLGQVVATSPQLLMQKPQHLFQVASFLKGLGLEDEAIGRILGRCPEIFMSSIEKTLKKKVESLSEIGVSKKHLPRAIRKYPELFMCSINKALLPRMTYLLKMGFSQKEIASMVGRFSPLLGYSIEGVLRPKYEFLCTMGKPLKEVVDYPRYFSYSLEEKIKPRYWAIKSRNFECSLEDMLGKNDEEFVAYMSKF